MSLYNIEIKASYPDPEHARAVLREAGARFHGTDRQRDTYFNISRGRLKLRDGNIEKALIFYHRPDTAGPKRSEVELFPVDAPATLRRVLSTALGVRAEVVKSREIWYLGNIKFHLDTLEEVGNFIEIEAAGDTEKQSPEELHKQVDAFIKKFSIPPEDMLNSSYIDMILAK